MKKKIILSIILLSFLLIFIKILNPPLKEIDRILDFKLGMSEMELRTIIMPALVKEIDKYSKDIVLDDLYYDEMIGVDWLKVLYLDQYISEDGYEMKDIEFYFFDNKLFRIIVRNYSYDIENWLEKEEAVLLKKEYKELPKLEDELKTITNEKSSGLISLGTEWTTNNNNIKCRSSISTYPNGKIVRYRLSLIDRGIERKMLYGIQEHEKKN